MKLYVPQALILPYTYNRGPAWFRRALVNAIPSKTLHKLRDMVDIMHKSSVEILEAKKVTLDIGGEESLKAGGDRDVMNVLRETHY